MDYSCPEAFLNSEERCEYKISGKMKCVWAREIDLLLHFISVCEQNNLRYWAGFGTLLGAVRHKGFIPWDDDMDVWMPREDYNRFISVADKAFRPPYFFQTTLSDNDYYGAFIRLRNSDTTCVSLSKNNNCNNGIYIDICPLDGLSSNAFIQKMRSFSIYARNVAAHAYMYNVNPSILTRTANKILRLPFVKYDCKKTFVHVNKAAAKTPWDKASHVGITVFHPYKY